MQLNLTISNVKCAGCVSNIETGLLNFAGVENIRINIESGTIELSGNTLDHSQISEKLKELGFPEC